MRITPNTRSTTHFELQKERFLDRTTIISRYCWDLQSHGVGIWIEWGWIKYIPFIDKTVKHNQTFALKVAVQIRFVKTLPKYIY